MFFRLCYIVKPIDLGKKEKLEFKYEELECPIDIELRPLNQQEIGTRYKNGDLICIATVERKVKDKVLILFESMENKMLPQLKQLTTELFHILADSINHYIGVLRWIRGNSSPHNPIRFYHSFECSSDGKIWKKIPGQITMGFEVGFATELILNTSIIDETINSGYSEPLGHELLCEAWELRNENPRSSLIICIAAAETGFKQCASTLMPSVNWLMMNTQSPPLIKMLKEFLPLLPVKLKIRTHLLLPPKEILVPLQKGINIRNEIVHGKRTTIRKDTLVEILKAVHDLLYLLDYYCGFKWAWNRISIETKQAMIKEIEST